MVTKTAKLRFFIFLLSNFRVALKRDIWYIVLWCISMRIIAGSARGQSLFSPKNNARPTLDIVRESLFNILAPEISGVSFLDLFCGSGAVGLEAASRGANPVYLVDVDTSTAAKNAEKTKLGCTLIKKPYDAAIRFLAAKQMQFNFIFADPPYNTTIGEKTLTLVSRSTILKPGGILMLEYAKNEPPLFAPSGLRLVRKKEYSNTVIDFYTTDDK